MNNFAKILSKIEEYILYFVFLALPLLFLPFFPNSFDTPKIILLFVSASLIGIIKILKSLVNKNLKARFSKYDFWVLLFISVYVVSSFVKTPNLYDAFFLPGTAGFVVFAGIFFLYFNQLGKKEKKVASMFLVLSAFLSSIVQILAFFKVFQQPGFNTLGSPTSFLVFMVTMLPISIFGIIKSEKIYQKAIYGLITFVIFVSSFISVYLLLPGKDTSLILPGYLDSWSIAADTLKTNPMLGIGPGNYVQAFSKSKPLSFNQSVAWDIRFGTATNQLFTIITEVGILGLVTLLGMLIFFLKKVNSEKPEYIALAVMALAFLLVPFSYSLLFVFFFYLSSINDSKSEYGIGVSEKREGNVAPVLLITLPLLGLIGAAAFFATGTIISEYYFAKSIQAYRNAEGEPAYNNIYSAIRFTPGIDRYHLIASTINVQLSQSIAAQENLTDDDKNLLVQLIQQGISEAKAATTLNPQRAVNWENLANIYRDVVPFAEGAGDFAITSYSQAIALEPINPNLRIALGGIYYSAQQYDEASRIFELAVLAKPDFANAHYNLAMAYNKNGEADKAKQQFEFTLSLLNKDSNDYQIVQKEMENMENSQKQEEQVVEEASPESLTQPTEEVQPAIEPKIELPEENTTPSPTPEAVNP